MSLNWLYVFLSKMIAIPGRTWKNFFYCRYLVQRISAPIPGYHCPLDQKGQICPEPPIVLGADSIPPFAGKA